MIFLSPIWLLGLLPWSGVALLLLLRRQPDAAVPFLVLWHRNAPRESVRREPTAPPIAILFALAAALLALLAAAQPAWPTTHTLRVDVIVDTGNSMSASIGMPSATPRFATACHSLVESLTAEGVQPRLTVVGRDRSDFGEVSAISLLDTVRRLPETALDTTDRLDAAIRRALRSSEAPVVVVTDRTCAIDDARIVQVTPPPLGHNVGVDLLAVMAGPKPQAMIRLRVGGSASTGGPQTRPPTRQATLRVSTSGVAVDATTALPAVGQTADCFIDLPSLGPTVHAEIVNGQDVFPADDAADLARERRWPRIEPAVDAPALQKLIRVYQAVRPPDEESPVVQIVQSPARLGDLAGIVIPGENSPTRPATATHLADHPIAMALSSADAGPIPAAIDRSLPAADKISPWSVVAEDAAGPLVAARELADPGGTVRRQVWSAVAPSGWATDERYVAFFATMIDWVAGVDPASGDGPAGMWTNRTVAAWQPVWQAQSTVPGMPGVYKHMENGRLRAFAADRLPAATVWIDPATTRARLLDLLTATRDKRNLAPFCALAAALALGAAAWRWRRRPPRPPRLV